MIKNFKLTIQYNGLFFHGWQIQPDQITVQGEIESVLQSVFRGQKINLIGSGRTDSGVHALGQVANVRIDTDYKSYEIKNILNAHLNKKIWIIDCTEVNLDFHSRFSALSRVYEYHMTKSFSPFTHRRETLVKYDLNCEKLVECSNLIIGEKDFSIFCKLNCEVKNKICNVQKSVWCFDENKMTYTIQANRFLHHMVRFLIGSMIEVSRGRISIEQFGDMLSNNSDIAAVKSPPDGLYLLKVLYE